MSSKATPALLLSFIGLALHGCTSTTFVSTWKAPDAVAVVPAGHRVAAVYISTDEGSRRVAENVLVRKINEHGAQGMATYSLFSSKEVADVQGVRDRLRQAGIDSVVTMRVIDEQKTLRVTYGPSGRPMFDPYYMRFGSFWSNGWGAPYSPGEATEMTVLSIEILVYSLEQDALRWAGNSRTSDPPQLAKLVEEVADAVAKEMIEQGVLAQPNHERRQ
jgi:hypothetical protein